jgi:CheY-like chemotaxis protein/two-component sensor histidine kinase
VESLLDSSRIAAGKLRLDAERVPLSAVLQSSVDSLRPEAEAKGIRLDLTVPSTPVTLIGDSGRLQQVFSNLLTNSIKFTASGGRVQIRLARNGSQAQVEVADNGEGISVDFLPHVFERFRQAEGAKGRAHGGLGLGLAIVRELVHAHGGTISADSAGKGKGSTFLVALPIPAVIPASVDAAALQLGHGEELSIAELRILVVDDDADTRELVAATLEHRGAVVDTASSAGEALDRIRQDRPDVMLADISMPHEDGYVLIQKLRALEVKDSLKRLPSIALTAQASAADQDRALGEGYDLHLAKPVALNDLAQAVAKLSHVVAT